VTTLWVWPSVFEPHGTFVGRVLTTHRTLNSSRIAIRQSYMTETRRSRAFRKSMKSIHVCLLLIVCLLLLTSVECGKKKEKKVKAAESGKEAPKAEAPKVEAPKAADAAKAKTDKQAKAKKAKNEKTPKVPKAPKVKPTPAPCTAPECVAAQTAQKEAQVRNTQRERVIFDLEHKRQQDTHSLHNPYV
jgi:hypothetical protein